MFVLIRALVTLVLIYNIYGNPIGDRNTYNVGLIGGYNISIEEAPYVVSLVWNGEHICGGSIIHKQFILTAAHCCALTDVDYKVRVGATYVNKRGKLYDVEKIMIHKDYTFWTKDYEICVMKLNNTLIFGPQVNKIQISGHDALRNGTMLKLSGWGSTSEWDDRTSECLQQVSIPFVSRSSCEKTYSNIINLTPRMFCAGEPGKDACVGDSGGPLTWNNIQVGVTAGGLGCGIYPGVYTKISTLRKWIKQTIEENL